MSGYLSCSALKNLQLENRNLALKEGVALLLKKLLRPGVCPLIYVVFYLRSVKKMKIHHHSFGQCSRVQVWERLASIVDRCPSMKKTYWPTWFAPTPMLQLILDGAKDKLGSHSHQKLYRREMLELRDGVQLALDWVAPISGADPSLPVCILLHGAFADSSSVTMTSLARALSARGFPVVVMNRRGYGTGTVWDQPKMQMFGDDDDLDAVTQLVMQREPDRFIAYIGFSCGAAFASRYVANRSQNSAWDEPDGDSTSRRLLCSVMLDSGHDVRPEGAISKSLLPEILNQKMKSRYARRHHKSLLTDTSEENALARESIMEILKPSSGVVETFKAIRGLSGYGDSWLERQETKLDRINVPSLFINSRDDPILVWQNVEESREAIDSNPNLVLLELHSGSHGCKYGFWGVSSVVDSIIPEWIDSCWQQFNKHDGQPYPTPPPSRL